MVKIVQLEEVRKEKSDDAADWSVLDALKRAVEMVETGEIPAQSVYIALSYDSEDGGLARAHVTSVRSHLEMVGLIAQHLADQTSASAAIVEVEGDGDEFSG